MPSQVSQAAHGLSPALLEGASFQVIGSATATANEQEVQLCADHQPEERKGLQKPVDPHA